MAYLIDFIKNKPLKKIPEYICYRHPKSNLYIMADKKGCIVGRMNAHPKYVPDSDTYYPGESGYYSFYINRLFVNKEFRNKGIGKAFLNIAAKESYRRNCDGKVHLIAAILEGGGKPPQKLYRKYGFDSRNKYHIALIDKAIKDKTDVSKMCWHTPMYLPKKNKLEK